MLSDHARKLYENGYRRARYSEVPRAIRNLCPGLLKEPLGSTHGPYNHGGSFFIVAIEPHANVPKGASVWISP